MGLKIQYLWKMPNLNMYLKKGILLKKLPDVVDSGRSFQIVSRFLNYANVVNQNL